MPTGQYVRTDTHRAILSRAAKLRGGTAEQRFWSKVDKSGDCWLWTGSKMTGGYGQVWRGGKPNQRAHRVAYELTYGSIPEGMSICHRCDVPLCVNPAHLFPGTYADNNADKARKGRAVSGAKQKNAKLTDHDVVAILVDSRSNRALAVVYGVTEHLISRIRRGKAWKHVPRDRPKMDRRNLPHRERLAASEGTSGSAIDGELTK